MKGKKKSQPKRKKSEIDDVSYEHEPTEGGEMIIGDTYDLIRSGYGAHTHRVSEKPKKKRTPAKKKAKRK